MDVRAGLGLLAATAILLGVSRSGGLSVVAGSRKTELTFWNGFTGPDGRTMLELIRKFNLANPDVQVSMQRMDWATYYNKLMVAAMGSRGPHLFIIHASTLPRMHRAAFLGDVNDLFEGPNGLPTEDFDPYVLKQVKFGNRWVGVPLDIHPQGLYCNADMLKAAGYSAPPRNEQEFLDMARKLRKDTNGDGQPDVWGFALTQWQNNFQSLLPQFGGRYLDEKGDADLDNPGNIKALQFMAKLAKEKLIPPPENGLGWVGFRQNKVAMVWDGVYMLGDLKRLQTLHAIAAPVPMMGGKAGTMADSHVLCLRKDLSESERKATERFIQFLSENSLGWADAGQVPARRSVRETPEFKAMPVQSAFARQVPGMMYPPRTPILFEMGLEIALAVEKVLRGREDAPTALRAADKKAQEFIDRDRREHPEGL